MSQTADNNQDAATVPERITRIVDFRIPLPWLLSGAAIVLWALISMYFELKQVSANVNELQVTVKSGNSQAVTLAGEQALLRYRVENLEAAQRNPQPYQQAPPRR
jgi:hypothetical protein